MVREWERRRASKVARRFEMDADLPLDQLGERIVEHKLEIGHAGIAELLRRELPASAAIAKAGSAVSRGRRRSCAIDLACEQGEAEAMPAWYADSMAANDERPLLAACPDHYLSRTNSDGSQEVIETTGGSPLAVRMFFDDLDTDSITTPADSAFPTQWVSVARTAEGKPIGGVRHQFRDEIGGGFHARLTVEFPLTTMPHMIAAHRWHLACEFSNWIEIVSAI